MNDEASYVCDSCCEEIVVPIDLATLLDEANRLLGLLDAARIVDDDRCLVLGEPKSDGPPDAFRCSRHQGHLPRQPSSLHAKLPRSGPQIGIDGSLLHCYQSDPPPFFDPTDADYPRRHGRVMDASHLLSASVTPVVLISACGLVTLALYNRLGTILARIRAFHQQKIELLKNRHEHEVVEQEMLMDMLDSQIVGVTVKARAIQKGLYCLLSAIAAFLFCSLFAGATELHEWVGIVALGMGFLGLCLFLAGLGWAMWELRLSLAPLEEENAYLEVLSALHLAKSQGGNRLKVAESA